MPHPQPVPGPSLLSEKAASEYTGLSTRTFQKRRLKGLLPRFVKLGRRVLYRREDLDEWIEASLRSSTSDAGSEA